MVGKKANDKNKTVYKTSDGIRLPLYTKPEPKAETVPGTKLRKLNVPVCVIDQPMNPPIETAAAPTYGPSIIPINGAKADANVMNFPTSPTIGKSDTKERTAYKAAKQIINAKSFALNCKLETSSPWECFGIDLFVWFE